MSIIIGVVRRPHLARLVGPCLPLSLCASNTISLLFSRYDDGIVPQYCLFKIVLSYLVSELKALRCGIGAALTAAFARVLNVRHWENFIVPLTFIGIHTAGELMGERPYNQTGLGFGVSHVKTRHGWVYSGKLVTFPQPTTTRHPTCLDGLPCAERNELILKSDAPQELTEHSEIRGWRQLRV